MSTIKGYQQQSKEDRSKSENVTISQSGLEKHALDVRNVGVYSEVAVGDLVEASSTTTVINATAHTAQAGDVIRFTTGNLQKEEASVLETDTNTITLAQTLSEAPGAGDAFTILRQTSLTVGSDGKIQTSQGPIQFVRDGVDTQVEEDTVTPANNRPLPVKLTGLDGDVRIDAANLDLHVQLEHDTANPDSVRIGDGTETVAVSTSNELEVRDGSARTSLSSIDAKLVDGTDIGDVTINNGAGASAVNVQDGGNSLTVDDGAGSLTIDNTAIDTNIDTTLSSRATEATLSSVDTSLNNIEAGYATEGSALGSGVLIQGDDGTDRTNVLVDTDGHLQVDVLTAPSDPATALDANNSSTSILGVSGVFTGTSTDISDVDFISVFVTSNQPSATDGLEFEFNEDGANFRTAHKFTFTPIGSHLGQSFTVPAVGRNFRITYTNGTSAQSNFQLSTKLHKRSALSQESQIERALDPRQPALTTKGVLSGEDPASAGTYVDAKVDSSGNLQVEDTAAGTLLGTIDTDTGNIATSTSNIDTNTSTTAAGYATEGSALGSGVLLQGDDGTDRKNVAVDPTTGNLQVDATISALDIVDLVDGNINDNSSSNIPGSAGSPLTVVASLAAEVKKIHAISTSGAFIGLYTGAAASEVLKCVIPPGNDAAIIEANIAASTRISVRRLDSTTAETAGFLAINFMG